MALLPPWSRFQQIVFKSPAAVSIWVVALFLGGALVYSRFVLQPKEAARRQAPGPAAAGSPRSTPSPFGEEQVTRRMARMNGLPTPAMPLAPASLAPASGPAPAATPAPSLPPLAPESLSVLDGAPSAVATPPPLAPTPTPPPTPSAYQRTVNALSAKEPIRRFSERTAPFGRFIKARTVNTLVSSEAQTPIVALTEEPVYWNGQLIVPIDSEIHGTTQPSVIRDRIAANSRFVLVLHGEGYYPNGSELVVKGSLLERDDADADQGVWGLYDGAFGLQGEVHQFASDKQIQLFISTFLSTAAQGLQTTQTNGFGGTQVEPTARNALLAGTSGVLNQYASQLLEYVKKNSEFVLVAGGHRCYLYVSQDVDGDDAQLGAPAGASFQRVQDRIERETDQAFRRELEPPPDALTAALRANAAARANADVEMPAAPSGQGTFVQPGGEQAPGYPPLTPGAERNPNAVYGAYAPATLNPAAPSASPPP